MRIVTRGILATLAGAGLIVITLAGCATPASPLSSPTPSAMHTPVFASDEEALKAATDAYAAYLAMSDTILADGGANPERLKEVATGKALEAELKGFALARSRGWYTTGSSTFDRLRVQSIDRSHSTQAVVTVYLCVDVSKVDVRDSGGVSVVSPSRPARSPI
ncbi:MAG: hypothetical protein JWP70_440, partial [Leifsonia sp.]|nr:hypothetical protein [Leifsonia sp.]